MDHNKIYHYEYEYNNVIHSYSIEIKDFIAGRDALAYINKKDSIIATIKIWDYKIDLLVDGFSALENLATSEEYDDYIPDFLHDYLDINCEYNLEKLGIVIKERNHFEFYAYKLVSNTCYDVLVEFTKKMICLPKSTESFLEDLKSFVIYLIQSDYEYEFECNSLDEEAIAELQQIIAINSIKEEEFMEEFMGDIVDNALDLFLD